MIPAMMPTGAAAAAFSPLSISGCVGWYDASQSATIHLSGSVITQWDDLSSSGNNITNAGTNKPTYVTGAQNGLNVANFVSSSSQFLFNSSAALLRSVAGWTLFCVCKTNQNTVNGVPLYIASSTAPGARAGMRVDTTTGYWSGFGKRANSDTTAFVTNTTQTTTASYQVYAIVGKYSTTTATQYINGTQTAQNTSWLTSGNSDNDNGQLCIGAATADGVAYNSPWDGRIGECVIYNSALGSTDVSTLNTSLRTKWGTA